MPTVKVDLPWYTGLTTLELAVYQDGVSVNSDGNDVLEEAEDSFGHFTADVSQSLSGTYEAVIVNAYGEAVAFGYFDSTTLLIGRLTDATGGDATSANQAAILNKQDTILSKLTTVTPSIETNNNQITIRKSETYVTSFNPFENRIF
jgi:hypothetical protein